MKTTLAALQTEKAEWEEKYESESQQWSQQKRALVLPINDDEAVRAAYELTRIEGIIPALESAHALGALNKMNFKPDDVVVLTVSGRGDKDMETYLNANF